MGKGTHTKIVGGSEKASSGCPASKMNFKLFSSFSGPQGAGGATDLRSNSDNGANLSKYRVRAPAGKRLSIYRCNVLIRDANPTISKFGGLAALTNGVLIRVVDRSGTVISDFLNGASIQKNCDFVLLAGIDVLKTSGTDLVDIRWTLSAGLGGPLILKDEESLEIVVQDNLTGLDEFRVMAQGRLG